MDRQTAARHIAKVFAFLACGQPEQARVHAQQLVRWLQSI
jgi:hypothetical protein